MKKLLSISLFLFACLGINAQVNYVNVGRAGTLQQILEQKGYMDSEGLVIAGELNGRDIAVLRALTGSRFYHEYEDALGLPLVENPKLKSINLYDARIVSGTLPYCMALMDPNGMSPNLYFLWHHTKDDVFTKCMFHPYTCSTITDFVTPWSIRKIEEYAFDLCLSLQSIYISEGVESIGDESFSDCRRLKRVVLPSSLSSIGKNAFSMSSIQGNTLQVEKFYCQATIPPVIENASECFTGETLENCEVYVPAGCGDAYRNSEWGAFAHIIEAENMEALFADMKPQHHDIPVDMVEEEQGPVNMVYVKVPGTLQQLVEDNGMTDSEKLIIGGNINGRDILYLRILGGLRNNFHLQNISYMNNIGLPEKPGMKLNRIDLYDANIVSGGGPYLMDDKHSSDMEKWRYTEDNVAGESLFDGEWRLTEVILPATIKEMGENIFYGAISLKGTFYVPDGVESMGKGTFRVCRELEEVVLPASLNTVGWGAFSDCEKLNTIYCLGTTPPEMVAGNYLVIPDYTLNVGRLVVPAGCAEAYRNAYGWSNFQNIVEADNIEALTDQYKPQHHDFFNVTSVKPLSNSNGKAQVFNLSGMKLRQPARGLNIVRTEDGKTRKVVI